MLSTKRLLNAGARSREFLRISNALSAGSNIRPREMRGTGILERRVNRSYTNMRGTVSILGRKDLSDSVRWVARDDGDGYGFDILSFNGKGDKAEQELWLEVKTTNGSATTPFYITRNELQVSKQRPDAFRLFRLI